MDTFGEMITFKMFRILNSAQLKQKPFNLVFKFATRVNNINILSLINLIYRHNDSDFNNGFIQGLLTSDLALPRKHIAVLRDLSRNYNIIISFSDKGGGVVWQFLCKM